MTLRDDIQGILALTMLAVCVFTLIYPWRFQNRLARVLVHSPLLLIVLDIAYEISIPVETNIRIDLLILWPAFGLAAICYGIKLFLWSRSRPKIDRAA